MRHARAIGVAGLAALVAGAVAFAQSTVEPLEENPPVEVSSLDASALAALKQTHAGDPENGATLAGTCAACRQAISRSCRPVRKPRRRRSARQDALQSCRAAGAGASPAGTSIRPQQPATLHSGTMLALLKRGPT